ncbi:MAG: 5-(carboxyamino)imidazole ribonucleotide synthase [Cyanobium sp. M30B3]|nr:MAG: 5-(carboxyamino)imidazole ribonucleotide synthase [Cyanobium sp. M30B3]
MVEIPAPSKLSQGPNGPSPAVIGVVGGGQLARMLAAAARELELSVVVQTPQADDPATGLAGAVVQAPLHDLQATRELARRCTAVTFENEWLDLEGLAQLAADGVTFLPSLAALQPLVSKQRQRQLLQRLGIPSPPWMLLADLPCLQPCPPSADGPPAFPPAGAAVSPELPGGWSYPLMAKAATGGYDGKGTRLLAGSDDLQRLLAEVDPQMWLLEAFVPFELELSQLVCRDHSGRVVCYPLVQTQQHRQVCDWVLTPAAVPHAVQAFARNMAVSLLTAIDYVGVLSIEFFYGPDGLQVNEIAPRTHNSGHVTIEACRTSQFAQQARIVAGLPLGDAELRVPGALMVNLLGFEHASDDYAERRGQLAALPGASVHWYGKRQASPGRKLGHVTLLLDAPSAEQRQAQASKRLAAVRAIWPLPPPESTQQP